MYHKKKIALFISHIYGIYQQGLCQGIVSTAEDYGYKTEVYTTSDGEDLGDYSLGESSILRIPNWSNIEGVVFASGTYTDPDLRNKICNLLKEQNCSVIEIADDHAAFPNISLENNLTAGALTSHLIDVHNAKRICYLGCRSEALFSVKREKAFISVMQQRAFTLLDHDIYNCDETPEDYIQALHFFFAPGLPAPDAFVCYNDRIALGLWNAASTLGYNIPVDFAVVGCDNSKEGQNVTPPLTTVTFPTYQLGEAAVNALFARLQGRTEHATTVFAEPVYRGSCGCSYQYTGSGFNYLASLNERIADTEHSALRSMRMSAAFSHISDIDEGMDVLEKYVSDIDHCSEFYLCLYSDWDTVPEHILALTKQTDSPEYTSLDDTILLKLAIRDGRRLPECSFPKTSLLPEFLENASRSAYIISPLFFENRSFGYIAMVFEDNRIDFRFKEVPWIMNITQLLANLCDSKQTRIMTEYLEDLYLKDSLTGLCNRHGFGHRQQELLKSGTFFPYLHALVLDLDELKTINDRFGHQAGDFALQTIGQAIRSTAEENDICCRFGGDEFYCLLPRDSAKAPENFFVRVEQYLEHFNKLNDKPYNISVSCGWATLDISGNSVPTNLRGLFQEADENMYRIKKTKVKHVIKDIGK